jgi:hypothetical protein
MGVRILIGREQGSSIEHAVLFDSVTGWAFGPLFREGDNGEAAEDRAQAFLDWLDVEGHGDARGIDGRELEELYGRWLKQAAG